MGGSAFSHRKEVSKIEGGGGLSLIFILTNSSKTIFLGVVSVCVCVLFIYTISPYLSVLFVFPEKKLVLLNLINRYVTSAKE